MSLIELEAAALQLSREDQVRLLRRLAVALDDSEEPELSNEELTRRWSDYLDRGEPAIDSVSLREQSRKKYGV